MNLHDFDIVVINTSGGKDSVCAIWEVLRIAQEQNYSKLRIKLSHQDLGQIEWPGTKDLIDKHSILFDLDLFISKYRNKDGDTLSLLQYVEKRGKWPSNKQRYCTSDFKRGPGHRVVRMLARHFQAKRVLQVFGFRKDESPARAKREALSKNEILSNKSREVFDWLPIHTWSDDQVWNTIRQEGLLYHYAYDLGMPRLSCCFCIFSPFNALVIAGKANPELLDRYVEVENKIGHHFRQGMPIASVKAAIENGYVADGVSNWVM